MMHDRGDERFFTKPLVINSISLLILYRSLSRLDRLHFVKHYQVINDGAYIIQYIELLADI
jgi:hypothetical protein